MKKVNMIQARVGTAIAVPVGLCTGKVLMDVTTKLLPKHVGIPVKIAYKVGTVGVALIADSLVRNAVEDAITGGSMMAEAWESDELCVE